MGSLRIIPKYVVALGLVVSCGRYERPIHPMRLDGFPGAPIEAGLFPLRDGMTWVFRDRFSRDPAKRLRLEVRAAGTVRRPPLRWVGLPPVETLQPGTRTAPVPQEMVDLLASGYLLAGVTQTTARIAIADGFLEIHHEGSLVSRPLKLSGEVGDTWPGGSRARCMAFGYDSIEVLGERRRALVVGVDRLPLRDIYWFVRGMGWVRIRTERDGRVIRDAVLESFRPGARQIDGSGSPGYKD